MDIKIQIRQILHDLGFELSGFTRPDPPPHLQTYLDWIENKHHAEMAYLSTERSIARRSDARHILNSVITILVVGMRYANPKNAHAEANDSLNGRVASYAWGIDYHEVIAPRLEQAAREIQDLLGKPVTSVAYSDSGPILERDYATMAGLGWIGKNTCLISPSHGSYFLLGELLLDVEIDADPPFPSDHCGRCTRCIDACPTSCILPDRTLDAGRCISYLTIEHKRAIDHDLRDKMGSWIFGCDICQQVCPWNERFAAFSGSSALSSSSEAAFPSLIEEFQLSNHEFKKKYSQRPQSRPKRRGYLRNVAIALGNSKSASAVAVLAQCLLTEDEALVRAHAAWALGRIGTPAALLALQEALIHEKDESVVAEIENAAHQIGLDIDNFLE